jgi:flagellar hook protein FlgE
MPFRTALSGLNASSAELRVIGNNVANASTTGFKESRTEFADIFASSNLGVTANAIGSGVRVSSVSQQFTQGNIGFTDNNLDLAISGQGFLIMNDNGVNAYTRAGAMAVDRDGYVVNTAGQRLTVFSADSSGTITGATGDLRLDRSDIAPVATTLVDMSANLNAAAAVPGIIGGTITPTTLAIGSYTSAVSDGSPATAGNHTGTNALPAIGALNFSGANQVSFNVDDGTDNFTVLLNTDFSGDADYTNFLADINGQLSANNVDATASVVGGSLVFTDSSGATGVGSAAPVISAIDLDADGGTDNFATDFLTGVAAAGDDAVAPTDGNFVMSIDGLPLYTEAAAIGGTVTGAELDAALATFLASNPEYSIDSGSFATGDLVLAKDDGTDVSISIDSNWTGTPGALGTSFSNNGVITPATQAAFDATDSSTYNNSTSVTVYDSLGASHLSTMYFRKTQTPNQWEVYSYLDGVQQGGAQVVEFDSGGNITSGGQISVGPFSPGTGAAPLTFNVDFTRTTQYGSGFNVNSMDQDGFTTGRLSGIDISDTGVITSRFTNGQSRTLGQVALANFNNAQGLRQLGDTSWSESFDSGQPLVGTAGSGSLGLIESGALEGSNVDLTEQLVNMITAQRNFQANAQVITTADTVTQTIINIR